MLMRWWEATCSPIGSCLPSSLSGTGGVRQSGVATLVDGTLGQASRGGQECHHSLAPLGQGEQNSEQYGHGDDDSSPSVSQRAVKIESQDQHHLRHLGHRADQVGGDVRGRHRHVQLEVRASAPVVLHEGTQRRAIKDSAPAREGKHNVRVHVVRITLGSWAVEGGEGRGQHGGGR
eukprot:UN0600